MDILSQYLNPDLSLWGLFISSLLAATLLPGGSEAVLVGVLKLHPELFWPALLLGTLGNTIGGMTTFGMGWMLPLRKSRAEHSGTGETASRPLSRLSDFELNIMRARQYGPPVLLLAWTPLLGDALCLAAGWLRQNPLYAALFMALGKFARYWLIAMTVISV